MYPFLKNAIGVLLCAGLLMWCVRLAETLTVRPQPVAEASNSQGIVEKVGAEVAHWEGRGIVNVALSFLVGALGASAFFFGVYTGFIGSTNRSDTLKYLLSGTIWNQFRCVGFFSILGGIVAAVFQAAQYETFAPIQAFVLGATWPSVVTRVMSGGDALPQSPATNLANPTANIPNLTTNKTAADAQVVI